MSTATQTTLLREPALKLTAEEVKDTLRLRHPAIWPGTVVREGEPIIPGAWTCLEEWMNVDLLAFGVWDGAQRVGYEVKVSRQDYRKELVSPGKRVRAVSFCHRFYFAVPKGLLDEEELAWQEPDDFDPTVRSRREWREVDCRCEGSCWECMGTGKRKRRVKVVEPNPALESTPHLWVPRDVGLVVIERWGEGLRARELKKSPRREPELELGERELGELVRWASARPDPRHRIA